MKIRTVRSATVLGEPKPSKKDRDSSVDPTFCAEYEKEKVKQDVLAACARADREAPKNHPHEWLRDAHMLLVSDDDYRARYKRSGASVTENAWDDPTNKPQPLQCIEWFRTAVAAGVIPDANTLIFVANSFAVYLEGKGNASLDVAFKMPSKQKVGNASQHKAKRDDDEMFLFRMANYRRQHPKATVLEAADACFESPRDTKKQNDAASKFISTMADYYKKNGWTNLEKMMDGGRIRFDQYLPPERK
jgi:hypothetical protein